MKRHLLHFLSALLLSTSALAQTFTPVTVSGFNIDGIADASDASLTTTQALDGSGYVLYSQSYGLRYGTGAGLPGTGRISNGRHSYQLQAYKNNNILYVDAGHTDSLILSSPASFAAISLLATSTDGNGTSTYTIRFTDGSSAVYSNVAIHDWFNGSNAIISGIDRAERGSGNPDNSSNNPRLYANDLPLSCSNRSKMIRSIVVANTGGSKTCILAVSGASVSGHSFTHSNPDCPSGSNGSSALSMAGGIHPYSYSWSTSPAQSTATATSLATGSYTVTVHDSLGCTIVISDTLTDAIGHSSSIAASADTVCRGSTVTLSAGGAASYVWSTGATTASISVSPAGSSSYSISATLADGCPDTTSITIVGKVCAGIDETHSDMAMILYPNPSNGSFTISSGADIKDMNITLTDMRGLVVYTAILSDLRAGEIRQVSMGNIAAGIYLMRLQTGSRQQVEKIVIER